MHGTYASAISTFISQSQLDFGQIHLCEFPKTHTFLENWDDLSVGIQRTNIITRIKGKFISDQENKFGGGEGKSGFFSEDILMYF